MSELSRKSKNIILFLAVAVGIFLLFFLLTQTNGSDSSSELLAKNSELANQLSVAQKNIQDLTHKNSVLASNISSLQHDSVGTITPPYTIAKGREFKTVFKKQDGSLVTWTWQASEFEKAFADSYVKLYIAPNFLTYANSSHENLVTYCKFLVTSVDFGAYHDYCEKAIANDTNQINAIATGGTHYFSIKYPNGSISQVIDYTEYVDSNTFVSRINDIYDPNKSDEENIREIWNISGQLTSYSYDLRGVPRHPLETLSEGGADCGGLSVLVASMLKAVPKKWKVELVYLDSDNPTNPKSMNHMIVHVDTGTYSTYIETTENSVLNPYPNGVTGWAYQV